MIDGVIVETAASPDNIAQIVKAIEGEEAGDKEITEQFHKHINKIKD